MDGRDRRGGRCGVGGRRVAWRELKREGDRRRGCREQWEWEPWAAHGRLRVEGCPGLDSDRSHLLSPQNGYLLICRAREPIWMAVLPSIDRLLLAQPPPIPAHPDLLRLPAQLHARSPPTLSLISARQPASHVLSSSTPSVAAASPANPHASLCRPRQSPAARSLSPGTPAHNIERRHECCTTTATHPPGCLIRI